MTYEIKPSVLKTKFEAGSVPKQQDFEDLIQLAGQVRGVEGNNGLKLDENGNLSIDYGTASSQLAGTGLINNGNNLEVNYAAVAGTGLTSTDSTLGVDIDLIWKKMLAKTHVASHYAEQNGVCIVFFQEHFYGHTRAYIYSLNDIYVGVDANAPNAYNKINLNNIRAKRFSGDFGAGAEDNIVRVAEWDGGIAPNSKIQMTYFQTNHNHHMKIETDIHPISELK